MKQTRHLLIPAALCCLLSLQSIAQAPVVDDSENFAILDEQQADLDRAVVDDQYAQDDHTEYRQKAVDEERPLAHDDVPVKNQSRVELLDKVQGMQQDMQELRGQLEVQSHELKLLKDQQMAFYKDLDARLRQAPAPQSTPSAVNKTMTPTPTPTTDLALNTAANNPAPSATVVATPQQADQNKNQPYNLVTPPPASSSNHNAADEQISYMAAYELVKNRQFDQAITAMQNFLTQYPHGGYTANAQYWLGELFMAKKNYPEAMQHFEVVLNQYPNSSKTAASMLKIGYALAASGKVADAKLKLQQVVKSYPDTPTAQLAVSKLKSLNAS